MIRISFEGFHTLWRDTGLGRRDFGKHDEERRTEREVNPGASGEDMNSESTEGCVLLAMRAKFIVGWTMVVMSSG